MDSSAALAAAANEAKDRDFQVVDGRVDYTPEQNPNREGRNILAAVTSVFRAKVPQLYVDVDRREAMTKHVELRELFSTLQVFLGSLYVNDFNLFGRTWQVIVQADSKFRNNKEDVARLKVRNSQGQMVPLGAVANVEERNGPLILTRYNMYTAAPINGAAPAGVSSGDSIRYMEAIARARLPGSMKVEWTELAYLELQAGNTAMIVFGFAVVMVFLVLAAQYESWALPLAVILVVPLCLFSAIRGVNYAKQDINIFTQIGFVVLVGLACKNAILIVEFARAQRVSGHDRREATLSACRLRLRPIVMTSMAFILGVVPLLFAHGAGAEMRKTLGTTVFSGMLGVTVFGLLLTPVFFYVIDWLSDTRFFHSRAIQRINRMIFGVLSMRYARDAVARINRKRRDAKPVAVPDLAGEPDSDPELAPYDPADEHAEANGNGHAAPRETTTIHHSPDRPA
jgi:multidrug efflux pump